MFPTDFLSRLNRDFWSDAPRILEGLTSERKGSFRINTLRSSEDEVLSELSERGVTAERAAIPHAFVYEKSHEYALKGSQAFYQGRIYVQSLSSMLPVLALDVQGGQKVLDVCAAPGSKTTQMAMIQGNSGNILALERQKIRFDTLAHNCRLQWATSVDARHIDALSFLKSTSTSFDRILLDAPCSGEGRFRAGDEKTYHRWNEEYSHYMSVLQLQLLTASVKRLAPGGVLVYSTCTLSREENEDVLSKCFSENVWLALLPCDFNIPEYRKGLGEFAQCARVLPSSNYEGFFVAKIVKSSE